MILDILTTHTHKTSLKTSELRENLKILFKLEYENSEINNAGKQLNQKKAIKFIEKMQYNDSVFQISSEFEKKINSNLDEIKNLEQNVIENWIIELCEKYKDYEIVKKKINDITECLKLFISKLFIRHGINCVSLLYPDKDKVKKWFMKIDTPILSELPKIEPFVDSIIKIEIPKFFENNDPRKKQYLTSLFNSSFYWHLSQIDKKGSRLLKEATKGQSLFIDNNIIYSLVGLRGKVILKPVHNMLNIARNLGYDLWVTNKTLEEFNGSLQWKMKELKEKPPIPKSLVQIAINNLGEDSFLTIYWKDFVANGTSIEEFITKTSYIETILKGLGIRKTNDYRNIIDGSKELISEESILRSCCENTSEHIIVHDAFHRIFINKKRGGLKYRYSDAVAWFLTHDNKLPRYDRVARKGQDYLPFCITTDQWIQINRPLLIRTKNQKDLEESFHFLLTQPFLRAMVSSVPLEKAYKEVLSRLSRYKNMDPNLVSKIVADKLFMITVATEEDENKIDEKLESKFVDLVKELEIKVDSTEKELIKEKRKTSRVPILIWIIFSLGVTLSSLFLWFSDRIFSFALLVNHPREIPIKLMLQFLIIFSFLNLPIKKCWKVWLGCIVAFFIAAITFLFI